MSSSKYFIDDLSSIFIEKIEQAMEALMASNSQLDKEYYKGQVFAYYDILETLRSQAEAFGITELKLDSIQLEKYLAEIKTND
jgi:hypothetical protein